MKKRNVAVYLCAVLVVGCIFTGCGGNASGNAQSKGKGAAMEQAQGWQPMNGMEMTMGKVTKINGNEITVALVNMPGVPGNGKMPEGKGERPEMPEGKEGERPEMPEGMFEGTGETKTIIIEDESIIVKNEDGKQVSGTLADIEVDSVISLSFDENDNLTQVMLGFGRESNK